MFKYIVKRLAYALLILLGVSMIIYFLIRLMPVDFIPASSFRFIATKHFVTTSYLFYHYTVKFSSCQILFQEIVSVCRIYPVIYS